ncbi:Uncharacterized protein SCF082_LOCUS238 [Durusdinium trenchii]|uniref:Uncharacterized protein n=1 Tax=Durusdinium trenchii TaxID=1381693 RepID=A0ABP0H850_9DINO
MAIPATKSSLGGSLLDEAMGTEPICVRKAVLTEAIAQKKPAAKRPAASAEAVPSATKKSKGNGAKKPQVADDTCFADHKLKLMPYNQTGAMAIRIDKGACGRATTLVAAAAASVSKKPATASQPVEEVEGAEGDLTEAQVKRHDQIESLMAELNGLDEDNLKNKLGGLDNLTMMLLWKRFTMNREMEGEDQKYAPSTSGPGSTAKKQMLLRAWLKDGGQLQKHYRQAVIAFELKNVSKEGYKWRSWKKTCDDLGKEQAPPSNGENVHRTQSTWSFAQEATKIRNTRLKASSSKATKEDTLADYENLTLDDVKAEDNWGIEVVGEEDDFASMGLDPDLKKFCGSNKNKGHKDPEDNPKNEKKNKWELTSQVSSATTKQELSKKLLAFKAELCKEQSFFQAAMVDADDKKSQDCKQAVAMVKLAVQACKKNHPKKKAKKEPEAGSDEGHRTSQDRNPQMTQQLWRSLDFDRPESLPIPWCLHGDAAPFTETDSIQVISFRCLLASMPVGDSQLLLAAIPKAAVSKETFNTIMECMAWSFTSLYEGKAPKKNHSGVPHGWSEGQTPEKGSFVGNLEWFASEFGFPYSSSNMICAYCLADQKKTGSERPFTDCRPTAPRPSHSENPGEAKMQLLNKKIAEMYGKLGIEAAKRIKHLTLNDVASSAEECPALKHIKGNKIRHFAPVALELSKLQADDRAGQHRVATLEELQRIYTLLGKNWKEWSPECGIALERAGQVLLAHYSWLANDAFEKRFASIFSGAEAPQIESPSGTSPSYPSSQRMVLWLRELYGHHKADIIQLHLGHTSSQSDWKGADEIQAGFSSTPQGVQKSGYHRLGRRVRKHCLAALQVGLPWAAD